MLYNKLKKGDHVYDKDFKSFGIVKKNDDIHNVYIEYETKDQDYGGSGFYCLDPSCDDYDGDSLKIIETTKI